MTRLRWKLLPTLLLALLFLRFAHSSPATAGAAGDESGGEAVDPYAPAREATPTTLGDLRKDPAAWLGMRVRFTVQFHSRLEDWNPLLTRFGSTDWVAFSAWADEDFTWEAFVFDNPMERLFARRGGAADELLGDALSYERFEVVAIVREVFLGDPWIEVESLQPLFELVNEGTILHVGRAYGFAREEQWDLAIDQFERAKSAPIPTAARAELDRKIAECQRLKAEPKRF